MTKLAAVQADHPSAQVRALTQLRRVVHKSTSHGPIFISRDGASGNAGAIQPVRGVIPLT